MAPTLLWLLPSPETQLDGALLALSWAGLLLSSLVVMRGSANMFIMAGLWALYMVRRRTGSRVDGRTDDA